MRTHKPVLPEIIAGARREEAQDAPSVDGDAGVAARAAKGMEWDAVTSSGLVDTMMPIGHADSRRLRRSMPTVLRRYHPAHGVFLQLSWADSRLPGGRARKYITFLASIAGRSGIATTKGQRVRGVREATGAQTGALSTLGTGTRHAKERSLVRCRTCPSNVNEDLLADLREWRTEKVSELIAERGSAIPAYVVAADATLEALAEQQPTSEEELAAIPGLGSAEARGAR